MHTKSAKESSSSSTNASRMHQSGSGAAFPGKSGDTLSRLVESGSRPVQAKLTVSKPGDSYEQEADSMASRVMAMPEPALQRASQPEEREELQASPQFQRQSAEEEEEPIQTQAEPEEEEEEEEEPVQMQAEEEEELQTQSMEEEEEIQAQPAEEEEEPVQTQAQEEEEELQAQSMDTDSARTAPPEMRDRLEATREGGQPLPDSTRTFMEDRFSADFSGVRVHTGPDATQMTRDLRAQAFTRGRNIYFNEGKFNPETSGGRRLLAHELTHVIQQGSAGTRSAETPGSSATQTATTESTRADDTGREESPESRTGTSQVEGTETPTAQTSPTTPVASGGEGVSEQAEMPVSEEEGVETTERRTEQEEGPADAERETAPSMGAAPAGTGAGDTEPGSAPPGESPEEQVAPEQSSSEETVKSFAEASATKMARTLPSLGEDLDKKISQEQEKAAKETPPLKASTEGVEEVETPEGEQPERESAEISEGTTEPEPTPETPEEHENAGEPPRNDQQVEEAERQADTGFLSWLRTNFNGFLSRVRTSDPGVKSDAGKRPAIDTSGKANPQRADRQKAEGAGKVGKQQAKTAKAIRQNKGKEKIQPVKVDEEKKLSIPTEKKVSIETSSDENVSHYAGRDDLPSSVRQAADKKMAPKLHQSLEGPKKEVAEAAQKRDEDKEKEISKAKQETAALNKKAREDQNREVQASRKEVEDKQREGLEEADRKMKEFDQEATTKETEAKKAIDKRIEEDEGKAAKKLSDAEKEADKKKKDAEKKARAKKKELKEKKEEQSWWDRAVSAVKSAVKAITSAIDAIFDAVRKAVKTIIEAAKDAALAVIEAGRKWITEKLDQFASWLKEKVSQYIGSVFPALADRINRAIDNAVNRAKAAVNAVANRLSEGVKALADKLSSAIDSILSKFQTALKAAVQIVGAVVTGDFAEAAKIAFMAVCEVAGIDPQPILDFINKAGDTLATIFKDPVAFFMNVVNGVKKGLQQFLDNIKKHLLSGLIGWLTGTLSEAGITLPETWDLKGIFHLVMQILGLTYQNIRAKIVKKLGPKGEQIVSTIEKTVDFVQDFIKHGPVALWDRVKSFLGDIKEKVMSGIRNWVITQVVKQGVMWLFSLLNPASAIVRAVKLLYDVVMFFVNRWDQIVSFAKSIFNSVRELTLGKLGRAANAVEGALARSVPVIISFLASLLGLGGVSKAVKNIITKIRRPIDKALDKVIGWLVKKGKALLRMGKSAVQKGVQGVKKLLFPSKTFKGGEQTHKIFIKEGTTPKLMISSETKMIESFIANLKKRDDLSEDKKKKIPKAEGKVKQINELLPKLQQAQKAEKDTTGLQQQVMNLEVELAAILRDILVYDNPLKTKEKYKLEGWVGTYGTMPRAKYDKLTPDHQPQASLLKYVATLPEFKGKGVQNVVKGSHVDGGYAINLHELRHKAGRTYGNKGKGTLSSAKQNIRSVREPISADEPDERRTAVIGAVQAEINKDVSAMKSVISRDKNFADIDRTEMDKEDKDQLKKDVRSKIDTGESRIKAQNLDRLK
ncbi:MAG: DUF4157 domain-containing protein [Candidatus Marinimicrobia bacterium]|nr:DUF4157 domain-containing protein [Candidatus Neomarinimicrobiota bacterium]MCF7829371.1 DUF4157 domain-containing protein [Candidatus Neomarinimicrobiota bacterium]MCF7880857.1 DUF4157 domain-containing protein [Candidatus Neomarinimicrobiota bacterium]